MLFRLMPVRIANRTSPSHRTDRARSTCKCRRMRRPQQRRSRQFSLCRSSCAFVVGLTGSTSRAIQSAETRRVQQKAYLICRGARSGPQHDLQVSTETSKVQMATPPRMSIKGLPHGLSSFMTAAMKATVKPPRKTACVQLVIALQKRCVADDGSNWSNQKSCLCSQQVATFEQLLAPRARAAPPRASHCR